MVKRTGRAGWTTALLSAGLLWPSQSDAAEHKATEATAPSLVTNQSLVEEFGIDLDLDINDVEAVFDYVLSMLPAEVKVYPTENYYYFRFHHGGIEYAGNIRLAAIDRDDGLVHFAYFPSANAGVREGGMHYKPLSCEDGVALEKLGPLAYRVTHGNRSVTFLLNDLAEERPPDGYLNGNEDYLGPVFDESGLEFFLVFNRDLKIFHYILNETRQVPDQFRPASFTDSIQIGRRTGFAFYRDQRERKILIGVLIYNVSVNNYYDGPFDQLPDNFIVGDKLKSAIEASDPSVVGRLDEYGYFTTGEGRYLIGPYLQYSDEQQLAPFHLCATNPGVVPQLYHGCFAVQGGGGG